jgi:hypothetical protein
MLRYDRSASLFSTACIATAHHVLEKASCCQIWALHTVLGVLENSLESATKCMSDQLQVEKFA